MALRAKQQAFVDCYTNATNKKTHNNIEASMLAANYSANYARHWNNKILANIGIKQAIDENRAKIQAEIKHNTTIAIKELYERLGYIQKAAENGNIQAVQVQLAIFRELDEITGQHKQRFIDETEQKRELSESEQLEARRLAQVLLRKGA